MWLRLYVLVIGLGLLFPAPISSAEKPHTAEIVVYGGTASGVMAAFAAARNRHSVILLEPGTHLGGMATGGLSATDLGHFSIIGGDVRSFYLKAAAHYGIADLNNRDNWRSEPHVSEAIFASILHDAGVQVYFNERLREKHGVTMSNGRITSLTTMDGKRWRGKVYIDCTYEGDLMAAAHVGYTWGRESAAQYGESLAGVRKERPEGEFGWKISAYDDHHRLLPEINPGPMAAPGTADKKVQAYTFRMILTNDPADRLPFPRPQGYDSARFALLARYLNSFEQHLGRAPGMLDEFLVVPIPNHKADFNNKGPFSTDYIGHSWDYPDSSYAQRDAIWHDHLLYVQSLMYFLANDPGVPAGLRSELKEWGLPKDEFQDTGHWPFQLYVREARRMLGAYVLRQSDIQVDRTKPDSIGMGSYTLDSHYDQRVALPDGNVTIEGNIEVPVQPYEIPYRILTPQKSEAQNLLVTVCLSASHVAYSTLRMEPQYMIAGQAAGEAAQLAVDDHVAVQDVPIDQLQRNLRSHGAILHLSEEMHSQTIPPGR